LLAAPAHAVAPHRDWRTILTPHFRVHYHEGLAPLAQRVAGIAEEAIEGLSDRLAHQPEDPIHVVLTDETDGPNGFAEVIPHNLITLFAAVPDPAAALGEYDDYWRLLVTHELAHVVHLDSIGGIPYVVNQIIGKQLSPNQVQPRWFIEGLAVWLESDLTRAGRLRSALFEMIVRAQAIDGTLPAIDEITTSTRRFPGGNSPYLYGGRFLGWLAKTFGSDKLAEVSLRYGSRLVPYGLNIVAREVFGRDYPTLWEEWLTEERAAALAVFDRVQREGATPLECVTGLADELGPPRIGPDGTLAIVESPRDDDTTLTFRFAAGHATKIRTSAGEGAFTGDGRFVAVIEDTHQQRYRYRDIEIIDVASGDRTRRTSGARLSDPDVHHGVIVAVETRGGSTGLVTLTVDGADLPRPLVDHALGEMQIFGPRWSPDGTRIAASIVATDGTRGLVLIDPASGAVVERLTSTVALDHAPAWMPDGDRIVFSSDRGGVFELHAIDLRSHAIVRLTASLTGALAPAVDPRTGDVYWLSGTSRGVALCSAPIAALAPRPVLEAARPEALAHPVTLERYPEERYADWETLLPKTLRASLALSSATGLGASIQLEGHDVVGRHSWALSLGVDSDRERLSYSFGYSNNMLPTPVSISSFLASDIQTGAFLSSDRRLDRRTSAWGLRVGLDVPLGSWELSHGFFFGYGVELRRPLDPVPRDPFQRAPRVLGALTLAPFSAGWRISNTRAFPDSISTARGFSFDISTSIHHPLLGSGVEVTDVSAHFTQFFPLPWADHHVLAFRAAGAVSFGRKSSRSTYAIGGLDVRNVILDAIDERTVGTDVIRGYEPASRRGSAFYLATAEYRLPFIDIERGIETLPAFVDRLHLAAFADVGDAPADAPRFEDVAVGIGAELRLDLTLLYYVPLRLRLGYARGLAEDGIDDFYVVLGGNF